MSIINFKRKYVNTGQGREYLFRLDNKGRADILKKIKKDWQRLIRLHFEQKTGITTDDKPFGKWKPLSPKYIQFKARKGLLPGILEASSPNLMTRYLQSIKYNSKNFSISIDFPELVTGRIGRKNPEKFANAGVHQLGNPKRRIIKKSFIEMGRKRLIEYFTK